MPEVGRKLYVVRLRAHNLSEYPGNESELTKFINRVASLCSEMEFFSKLISEAGANLTDNKHVVSQVGYASRTFLGLNLLGTL